MSIFTFIESVSQPARLCNEDAFGHVIAADKLDAWIIDGATSVADEEYLELSVSDPAWFAQALNGIFHTHAAGVMNPPDIIRKAQEQVCAAYRQNTQHRQVPVYAQPLAAVTWARIRKMPDGLRLSVWSMGDSRFLVRKPDGKVSVFPDIVRGDVTTTQSPALPVSNDSRSRTGVLMSHMERIRARRIQQHTVPEIAALGFHPDSTLHATHHEMMLTPGSELLGVSDGFFRLVDEYGLYDAASLIVQAGSHGLKPLYDELRAHEARGSNPHAIKNNDDATALLFRIGNDKPRLV